MDGRSSFRCRTCGEGEKRVDKNNKWYKLGLKIGSNTALLVLLTVLMVIFAPVLIIGSIALEGLALYVVEVLLFPLLGWSVSITYFQCCAIAVATDIVVNLLKSIFKGKD